MENRLAKEAILDRWEDILQKMTSPAKERVNGRASYICPLCRHGEHGDGLALNPKSKDGKGLKCFGCGFSGDIIDLVGAVENITAYPEKLKKAGALLGIDIEDAKSVQKVAQNEPKSERSTDMSIHTDAYTQKDSSQKKSLLPYFKECQARLGELQYLKTRGISEETAKRFMLGYDPKFYTSEGNWEALIIPTGEYSCVARNTDPNAKSRYRNKGESVPLNHRALKTATTPIFITEGELDALSIMEVGAEAIGLGSAEMARKFVREYVAKQKPAKPLMLALDDDKGGREATEVLAKELDELGVQYRKTALYNGLKDANEALQADREALKQAVALALAQEEDAEKEEADAEKEKYLSTSAYYHLQDFINGIAENADTPAQTTGYPKLDSALDGGLYEGLYILGAITSLGKTTLALQIADQIAQSGRDVLIFSLEMARSELMSKSISRLTLLDVLADPNGEMKHAKTSRGITAGQRYATYCTKEIELINRAITAYEAYASHIYIHEGVGDIGVDSIRETIEKHKRITGNLPCVIVDYLQILAPNDIRATDKQNTDKAVLELKRISRDFKIPVIGISSFNRASYKEEVTLEAFKESGSIEYGSDVLIGLQLFGAGQKNFDVNEEKKKNPREVELVILKNRNGQTGTKIEYRYYPMFNYLQEI